MKALHKIVFAIIVLAAISVIFDVIDKTIGDKPQSASTQTTPIKGYVIDKPAFMASCVDGALEGDVMTSRQANDYCGCAYQRGIDVFGGAGFTRELEALDMTNTLTSDMNGIVNHCVVYALGVEDV